MSTTMALVRLLTIILRDKEIGRFVVPIVPDEARTFGMEGMFRQLGIYSSVGQLYEPVDADQVMYYREDKKGQILEEGINEAGAMSSWIAAATAYANHGQAMIPFYIYYSMFGFQRIGDLAWAAGDMRARGFLIGGTAGRTTLAGEGLQHQDGHSLILASTIPNCVAYDPAYAYELAVIVQDGMRRMYQEQESCFYYITAMNENYLQPAMPEGAAERHPQGHVPGPDAGEERGPIGSSCSGAGTILREVLAAADLLARDFGVGADVWSVTSFNELRREGIDVERWNMLHPEAGAAADLCGDAARRDPRPGHRRHRLHAHLRRPDPALLPAPLRGAGHRRLRAQRHAQPVAQVLRGQPLLHRPGRPQGPGRRGRDPATKVAAGDREVPHRPGQAQSGDGLTARRHGLRRTQRGNPRRHPGPRHRGLRRGRGHRDPGDPGDRIEAEQSLLTLESDKATMEIPAPAAGVVQEIKVQHRRQDRRRGPDPDPGGGRRRGGPGAGRRAPARRASRRHRLAAPAPAPVAQAPAASGAEAVAVAAPGRGRLPRHPGDRGPGRPRGPGRGGAVRPDPGERQGDHGDPVPQAGVVEEHRGQARRQG